MTLLFDKIQAFRAALIKSQLEKRFRVDPRAREFLFRGKGRINASLLERAKHFAQVPKKKLDVGFVGTVPVAIERGDDGRVEEFYFRFE